MAYACVADNVRSNASPQTIRVFVAEDHQITLWGLRQLIDASRPRMEVVGTATSRAELLGNDAIADVDVVLLDLDLAGEDSATSLSELRQRCRGRVLVLTGADDVAQHRAVVLKGACGVVHKSEPAETILRAIEKVSCGEAWLNRSLLGDVLGLLTDSRLGVAPQPVDQDAERIASLTTREREIVSCMLRSVGSKQFAVASGLGMSEHTLRNHLTSIYSKLGVRGRLELHVYATAHGLGANSRSGSTG